MTSVQATSAVTRAWRYEGYEGGIEDSLILVDGEQIGGVYFCSYNPAEAVGWGHNDGGHSGETWTSYGPRGYSFGHPTRETAEETQVREYATNPDLYDRRNEQDRAEKRAEQDRQEAELQQLEDEREEQARRRRLGDDEPGPAVWTLPAYHVLYAPMAEVEAVSKWFTANDLTYVNAIHGVRVEQRATRWAVVYEAVKPQAHSYGSATETHVVTLAERPPVITTPDRPDLHELLKQHWPSRFPLIDFGATMACGHCTREARAAGSAVLVSWPCPAVDSAVSASADLAVARVS